MKEVITNQSQCSCSTGRCQTQASVGLLTVIGFLFTHGSSDSTNDVLFRVTFGVNGRTRQLPENHRHFAACSQRRKRRWQKYKSAGSISWMCTHVGMCRTHSVHTVLWLRSCSLTCLLPLDMKIMWANSIQFVSILSIQVTLQSKSWSLWHVKCSCHV